MKEDNEPIGTKKTGYAPPRDGPFKCGHCLHYSEGMCSHPDVMADPEIRKAKGGEAIVESEGCCNEYRPSFFRSGMMISLLKKSKV